MRLQSLCLMVILACVQWAYPQKPASDDIASGGDEFELLSTGAVLGFLSLMRVGIRGDSARLTLTSGGATETK